DLRQPRAVGVARLLPGQAVAPMRTLPFTDASGEVLAQGREGRGFQGRHDFCFSGTNRHVQGLALRVTDHLAESAPSIATTTPARTRLRLSGNCRDSSVP